MKGLFSVICVIGVFALLITSCNHAARQDSIKPKWVQSIDMFCPTKNETLMGILSNNGSTIFYARNDGVVFTRSEFRTNYSNCTQIGAGQPLRIDDVAAERYHNMARIKYPEGI